MPQETTAIQQRYSFRQDTEPSGAPDAATWINPTGGVSGNNVERYTYNRGSDAWELVSSVGPDTPTRETVGATWRDTANAATKVYDGSTWVSLAPDTTGDGVIYTPEGNEENKTAVTGRSDPNEATITPIDDGFINELVLEVREGFGGSANCDWEIQNPDGSVKYSGSASVSGGSYQTLKTDTGYNLTDPSNVGDVVVTQTSNTGSVRLEYKTTYRGRLPDSINQHTHPI